MKLQARQVRNYGMARIYRKKTNLVRNIDGPVCIALFLSMPVHMANEWSAGQKGFAVFEVYL